MAVTLHRAPVAAIDPLTLYRLLWLRVTVFVVEQQAAYPEIDGRDIESGAELMWAVEGDDVLATLRILREAQNTRIGRVATAPDARGRGIAADLMRAAVDVLDAEAPGIPILLDAQAHLAGWYGRFGFVVSGPPFAETAFRTFRCGARASSRSVSSSANGRANAADRAFLFDMYRRREVRRYLGDGRVMVDASEVDALLDRWAGLADGVLGVRAVATPGGARLGSVLLKRIPWSAGPPMGVPTISRSGGTSTPMRGATATRRRRRPRSWDSLETTASVESWRSRTRRTRHPVPSPSGSVCIPPARRATTTTPRARFTCRMTTTRCRSSALSAARDTP